MASNTKKKRMSSILVVEKCDPLACSHARSLESEEVGCATEARDGGQSLESEGREEVGWLRG